MKASDKFEDSLQALDFLAYLSNYLSLDNEFVQTINDFRASVIDYKELKALPYEFNKIFAEYGWVATDEIPIPLMEDAIDIYKNNGLEAAEKSITDKFNDEYLETKLPRMNAIFIFKGRERLIRLAYEDHKNKRYHASVPVVLSQIDGLMFDIAGHSFYDSNKKAEKFDYTSLLTGLRTDISPIAKKMNKPRNRTSAAPLLFPYRNGILHGRDLNYDSEIVSTKCFFNLLAIRPWALFIQNNEFSKRTGEEFIEIPHFKVGQKLEEYFSSIGLRS